MRVQCRRGPGGSRLLLPARPVPDPRRAAEQTGWQPRCYSLSSSPTGGPLTVTVKRTVGGYASNWICDELREGATIRSARADGDLHPGVVRHGPAAAAAGCGITPVMSITRTALLKGSGRVVLFYANRDEASVIFACELAALAAAHPDRLQVVHWLESVQGLPSRAQMRAFVAPFASCRRLRVRAGPVPRRHTCGAQGAGLPARAAAT